MKTGYRTQGYCGDKYCDDPEEKCPVTLCEDKIWRCDGCLEAEWDQEEFINANRQDMIESGWY